MKKILALTLTALTMSGCVNMLTPLGKNKYDCNRKEDPNSPYCRSFKAVESATSEELPLSRYDQPTSMAEFDRLTGVAPDQTTPKSMVQLPHLASNAQGIPGIATGTPVRLAPVIQRIWIKSFVDANDSITSDVIVYREVIPARWSGFQAGENVSNSSVGRFPFKPMDKPSPQPANQEGGSKGFNQPGDTSRSDEGPALNSVGQLPK